MYYVMAVIVDEDHVVDPKVCCDCPFVGTHKYGYMVCGIDWKRVPDEADTEKPENYQCPVAAAIPLPG